MTNVVTLHTVEDAIRTYQVVTVTEIARRLGMSRNDAFNEMFKLCRQGRVTVDRLGPSSRYSSDETTWRWCGDTVPPAA